VAGARRTSALARIRRAAAALLVQVTAAELALGALTALPGPAAAQPDPYRQHMDNGIKLFHDGNFEAALVEFEAAYKARPKASPLLNIALCQKARFRYPKAIAALELVPHVLAAAEHHDHVSGGPTPVLDLHTVLQVLATPALGLTGAGLAIAVARAAGTAPARVLGAIGAVGGIAYAAAGPLIALTDDVSFSPLFAAQAGLAVWLVGTAVRLAVRTRVTS